MVRKVVWMALSFMVASLGLASLAAARRLDTVQKERVREEREQRREQKAVLQDEERERQQNVVERSKRTSQHGHMGHDDLEDDRLE